MNRKSFYFTPRYAFLALAVFSSLSATLTHAQSRNSELRGEIKIENLPEGTHALALRTFEHSTHHGLPWGDSRFEKGLFMTDRSREGDKVTCRQGSELEIRQIESKEKWRAEWVILHFDKKNECDLFSIELPKKIQTVGEFNDLYRDFIKLVYRDPYKDLPDDVVTDLVMEKITTAIKNRDYANAIPNFIYLEERSEKLPESFWYFYMETASNVNDNDNDKTKVRALGMKYIKDYGKNGKYYDKVISLMAK